MCSELIPEAHSHVVNLQHRNLMCACRACYLLFTQTGAAQGRYRAVPDRYLYDPAFALTDGQWDDLQIPVKMAFFFRNSTPRPLRRLLPQPRDRPILLPLEVWATVLAANPAVADLESDVEVLLLSATAGPRSASSCPSTPARIRRSRANALAGIRRWRGGLAADRYVFRGCCASGVAAWEPGREQ